MNRKAFKILVTFVFFIVSFVPAFSQKNKKTETVVIKTNIYCDHCLQCESCGDRIGKGLAYEKGVKSFVVDEKAMTITVVYKPKKTTVEKIKQAITLTGYDADEMAADIAAKAALDDCCKKRD